MSSKNTGATGLAGRYAAALYELADGAKNIDAVAADLRSLGAMIEVSGDLERLIRSPVISREDQTRALDALLAQAGADGLTRRFVGVVAGNRRLFALPDMIEAYLATLAARRGEVAAQVTSARGLSDKQVGAIADVLKRALGGAVSIDARVDPGLIGGLVVRVGSRMIDSSLRTKLQQLRLAIRGAG